MFQINNMTKNNVSTLVALFFLFPVYAPAQDTIIPDFHGDKESFEKIKNKIIRKEVATFTIAGEEEDKSKIKLMSIPVNGFNDTSVIFLKDSIKVVIKTTRFDKSKHKLQYIDKYLVKIDNKPFWGTDGEIPAEAIKSVEITNGATRFMIPKSAINDLFNPNLCRRTKNNNKPDCSTSVYISNDRKRLYITMLNSDGAGGYEITWIIQDKTYLMRVIDYGF